MNITVHQDESVEFELPDGSIKAKAIVTQKGKVCLEMKLPRGVFMYLLDRSGKRTKESMERVELIRRSERRRQEAARQVARR